MAFIPFNQIPPGIPVTEPYPGAGGPNAGAWTGLTTGTLAVPNYTRIFSQIGQQIQQIQWYMAPGSDKEPGSLTSQLKGISTAGSGIMDNTKSIAETLQDVVGSNMHGANSIQQSLSTIASVMTLQLITQQLALADQINNNEFHQQATNQARFETNPNAPPIEVKPEAYQTKVVKGVSGITNIQAQAFSGSLITSTGAAALDAGTTIVGSWVKDTAVGGFIFQKSAEMKKYMKQVYTDANAKLSSSNTQKTSEIEKDKGGK